MWQKARFISKNHERGFEFWVKGKPQEIITCYDPVNSTRRLITDKQFETNIVNINNPGIVYAFAASTELLPEFCEDPPVQTIEDVKTYLERKSKNANLS